MNLFGIAQTAAPIVEIPEYTNLSELLATKRRSSLKFFEYTGPIGTASDQAAPILGHS